MSMFSSSIEGKVAIITAAGAGIGRAIASEWARHGGIAVVTDFDGQAAQDTLLEIGEGHFALRMDVSDLSSIQSTISEAIGLVDGVDALFNVAGVNLPKNVEEIEDEEWLHILDTNMTSVYRCSKSVIPEMRRRGGGAIVNVASIAGMMAENRCSAYSASKGGVVLLTRNMGMDFAKDNIRVNAVCPGATLTPRIRSFIDAQPEHRQEMEEMCPMKRFADPIEIARPALFLASSDASYITGASLVVDGGLTAGFRIALFDRM